MGEKIVVGPIQKGLSNYFTPFNIDNDSFPVLINAYQWRGRVKRKRGTSLLNRAMRYFSSTSTAYSSISTITLDASGNGNLLTGFGLQAYGNIVPGSVTITAPGPTVYTDPSEDGTLSPSGSINYGTGAITILAQANQAVSAVFLYYPDLPIMGLEALTLAAQQFPGTICFDTTYAYNILTSSPYDIYDVSFYKNPATGTYPGFTRKTTWTPLTWNGEDYRQFYTINEQGALWTTNVLAVPFQSTNIGMPFKPIVAVTVTSGTTANLQITGHGLVVGDFVFINEVLTTTGINLQTGYVTTVTDANNVVVTFPSATLATNGTGGIAQYLTNRPSTTKDCMRWYDGDPTNGNPTNPTFNQTTGWVNFCPPLSQGVYSIDDNPAAIYYLVTAKIVFSFKDRLLFLGPVIQTSTGSPIYLPDTVIYSQNGTFFYTASFAYNTVTPTAAQIATATISPILVPTNQTATPAAWWEDQDGFGGWIAAGVENQISTVTSNEDVLVIGFANNLQTRLVYTGNDILPFNFFSINSELGSSSTFSAVNLDRGAVAFGQQGITITSQVSSQRIDLEIPDQAFKLNLLNNGIERVTAQRDFINEWIYFSYSSNQWEWNFPTQTLLFNYRDNSWGLFNETFTAYGQFRKLTGETWATIGNIFPTWGEWNEPWGAGSSTLLQPLVIGGDTQGFVLTRDDGTTEQPSLEINDFTFPVTITGATQANPCVLTANNNFRVGQSVTITGVVGMTQLNGNTYPISSVSSTTITINADSTLFGAYVSGGTASPTTQVISPNHCLNTGSLSSGDFIKISGCIGTIASEVNGKVFSVTNLNSDPNSFGLNPEPTSGTYFGGGVITRYYVPLIQTKQFNPSWGLSRKTRIGPQQYLLSTTQSAQITLQIYLSQDGANPYNDPPIVPELNSPNDALVYSNILYTCPESTNLGLTPFNVNLQMPTAINQSQIWHRMNTSLLGDTVQIGFTLSEAQMRDPNLNYQVAEIELHSMVIDVNPSQILA